MILIFAYSDVPRKQIVDIADSLGGSIVGEIPEIYQYQIQVGFTECIIVNASYFYISKEFVRDNIDMDILTELLSLGGLGIQYCIKSRLAYEHLQEVQDGLLSVDYMEFREKYNQRDVSARQKMRELIDSDANKVTNVFSTLL